VQRVIRPRWSRCGINSEAGLSVRWGGHVEGLRRRRGDAVGVKAGASLIDRFLVNVGTIPVALPAGQPARLVGRSVADRWPWDGAEAP
jgi:hypothetical protein